MYRPRHTVDNPLIEIRNSLWYQKFDYRFQGIVPFCYFLRDWPRQNEEDIEHACYIRKNMDINTKMLWGLHDKGRPYHKEDPYNYQISLCKLLYFLQKYKKDSKAVIEGSCLRFYSNDLEIIKELSDYDDFRLKEVSKVKLVGNTNNVLLKKSDYTHRTYFNRMRLTEETHLHLSKWIESQDIKPCPSMKHWLKTNRVHIFGRWLQDTWFIDHNDKRLLTLLMLIVPGVIKQTKEILIYK